MDALKLAGVAKTFTMHLEGGIRLPVRMVSKTPAEAVGLRDRGEIAVGKRGDLIRIRLVDKVAAARSVWHAGRRVT
jgi:alpha-D-ribose 1-methylphosphonate 5-triphosphate diphosphatase PhnM